MVNTRNIAPRCVDPSCYRLGQLHYPPTTPLDNIPDLNGGLNNLMFETNGVADPSASAELKPNFSGDVYSRANPLPLFFQFPSLWHGCGGRKRIQAYTWSQGSNFRPRGAWHNSGLWSFSHTTVSTTEFVNVFIRFDHPMDIWLGPHSMQNNGGQTEYFRHAGICDEYYPGPGAVVNRRINNTGPFQYQDNNEGPSWFVFRNRLEVSFTVRPWNRIYSGVHLRVEYGPVRYERKDCAVPVVLPAGADCAFGLRTVALASCARPDAAPVATWVGPTTTVGGGREATLTIPADYVGHFRLWVDGARSAGQLFLDGVLVDNNVLAPDVASPTLREWSRFQVVTPGVHTLRWTGTGTPTLGWDFARVRRDKIPIKRVQCYSGQTLVSESLYRDDAPFVTPAGYTVTNGACNEEILT